MASNHSPWEAIDIRTLLAPSAVAIGAGTPTDQGVSWRQPFTVESPITLGGGIPDPETLPALALQQALSRALLETPAETLQYGGVFGYDGLRQVLADRYTPLDGVDLSVDNFITTNGGAGGIDNVCAAFLEPGDVVLVEAPTFSGSLRTFRGHSAELMAVQVDAQGIVVDSVRERIALAEAAGKRVKLVYTVADFHNPTGTTMSADRRDALIQTCAEHRVLIVEDAAYSEIYFRERVPSLYRMAGGQGILRVSTFSKPIATGLRVGWVQGREDVIEALSKVRFDMGISPILLRMLADYVGSGQMDRHLDRMRPIYAAKVDTLCRSLQKHCADFVRFDRPEGGFFLWVDCIDSSAADVTRAAADLGLMFAAGSNFFIDGEADDTSHVRLAYSTATIDELEEVGPRMRQAFLRTRQESRVR